MEENKGENSTSNRAHDQETQTNFDMNGTTAPSSEQTTTVQTGIPNMDRGHQHYRSLPSWGGRYPYAAPSNYPEGYYPYEGGYPPTPQAPPYYRGQYPHWHQPGGQAPYHPTHAPPIPGPTYRREYPHAGYYPSNTNEIPPRRGGGEIARPKAEWPRGYQPFPKPTIPSDYLASIHASHRNAPPEYTGPPSTATSLRSTVIDLPSPRASARMTRKRARSNTPASSVESIDLNLLIRNSPDSLLGYLGGTRLSSAGSFGHLSPTGFCTSPACRRTPTLASRPPPFITPPPIPPLQSPTIAQTKDLFPSSTTAPHKEGDHDNMSCGDSPPPPPSALQRDGDIMLKKEDLNETCKLDSTTSLGEPDNVRAGSDHGEEGPGEAEGIDLTCHWKECTVVFDNQESLVKHVNGDHIKKEKRDFTCYWQECSREQRPFKAQYMLVVHMRRHTGEKPHKCSHDGCSKAYSRLENLKTHLRSHTGERPYVCEVEGCNKAFSNASDRAKHQNRTHSSVKPYVCKVPGCPKRYTDPSSLRKHTKTVHGEQGIKRLKEEGSRDKPPHNPTKKSTGPSTGQSTQPSSVPPSSTAYVNSPASDVKSPGSADIGSGISYSSIVTTSSYDIASPASEIHGEDRSSVAVNQTAMTMHSPRSPPYVNQLPNIVEGDLESAVDGGGVTSVQQAQPIAAHARSVSLPKIQESPPVKKDVMNWVVDVHRRMSEISTRRSSEASHLSADMPGDASRRSSESGWASNNGSRRSSEASPFPTTQIAIKNPFESLPHPPSIPGHYVVTKKTFLQSSSDLEENMRRASETSTTSAQSIPINRRSRNSSGYGSQSNLAVIRSSGFQYTPMGRELPYYPLHRQLDSNFRRKSDTVICEADSSGMASHNNKEEYRRRSEPTRNIDWTAHRHDLSNQLSPREPTNEIDVPETELISEEFSPSELDAYLSPAQQDTAPLISPSGRQTQPLRHFPYPQEPYPEQVYPRESQTIHHRPYPQQPLPNGYYPPRYAAPSEIHEPMQRSRPQYMRQQQQQQQQPRLQSLPQGQMVTQYYERYPSNQGMYPLPQDRQITTSGYEDAMVNGMGALTTDNTAQAVTDEYGLGNMVVNDMNTLLNSLAEEDKYLEIRQNARGMNGSAMSSIF